MALAEIKESITRLEVLKSMSANNPGVGTAIDAALAVVRFAENEIAKSETRATLAEETVAGVQKDMDTFQARAETAEAEAKTAVAALKHMLHLRSKEKLKAARKQAWTFISRAEFGEIQREIQKILKTQESERATLVLNLDKWALASEIVVNMNTGHSATSPVAKRREQKGDWVIIDAGTGEIAEKFETRAEAVEAFHQNYAYLRRRYDKAVEGMTVRGVGYDPTSKAKVFKTVAGEAAAKGAVVPGLTDTSNDARDELEDPQGRRPRHPVVHPQDG